jgi:hypothetical protein
MSIEMDSDSGDSGKDAENWGKQTATRFVDKPVCNLRIFEAFEAHLCLKSA